MINTQISQKYHIKSNEMIITLCYSSTRQCGNFMCVTLRMWERNQSECPFFNGVCLESFTLFFNHTNSYGAFTTCIYLEHHSKSRSLLVRFSLTPIHKTNSFNFVSSYCLYFSFCLDYMTMQILTQIDENPWEFFEFFARYSEKYFSQLIIFNPWEKECTHSK